MAAPDTAPRVLIVEDDEQLGEMLVAYFGVFGYEVDWTTLGEEAVRLAARHRPDLIILDVHLPGIDGFEVCRRLIASHQTRWLPTLFLTERRDRVDRIRGLELGVVDYITKPFDVDDLRLRVQNILARAAAHRTEHPITGLASEEAVNDWLAGTGAAGQGAVSLLAARLAGLGEFREQFGFVAADDVLRLTAAALYGAVEVAGGEEGFCGHLDDETLLLAVPHPQQAGLLAALKARIGGTLAYYYPPAERDTLPPDALAVEVTLIPAGTALSTDAVRHALLAAVPVLTLR